MWHRLRLACELMFRREPDFRLIFDELLRFAARNRQLEAGSDDRFSLLTRFGRSVLPEYRFTWPQLAWGSNGSFNAYLKRFGEHEGYNMHRRWAVHQLLRLTGAVRGDTAECGVYQGAGSYLMAAANRCLGGNRLHHAFDSFSGLSAPSALDGNYWTAGDLSAPLEATRANLAEFGDAVKFYPGWIPERFHDVAECRFRFVHIDVDLYEPTRDSLAFFYPRVEDGGIIVCDDYWFTTCPGATRAVDEFLANKPEKMLPLAQGGGFLVKGQATAL